MEDINQLNQSIIRDYIMNCFSFEVSNFIYYRKASRASRQFILNTISFHLPSSISEDFFFQITRVGTLIVATIYLQLIQNRYIFRSFTVLQCSHQHCVQPVSSDVEVVGYL